MGLIIVCPAEPLLTPEEEQAAAEAEGGADAAARARAVAETAQEAADRLQPALNSLVRRMLAAPQGLGLRLLAAALQAALAEQHMGSQWREEVEQQLGDLQQILQQNAQAPTKVRCLGEPAAAWSGFALCQCPAG